MLLLYDTCGNLDGHLEQSGLAFDILYIIYYLNEPVCTHVANENWAWWMADKFASNSSLPTEALSAVHLMFQAPYVLCYGVPFVPKLNP